MKAENPTANIYNQNALQSKIYDSVNIYFEWKFPLNPQIIPTVDDVIGEEIGKLKIPELIISYVI